MAGCSCSRRRRSLPSPAREQGNITGRRSSSRRLSPPSPVGAHPLEDDNLLREILLRLPPQPPCLLRASFVSTRWRSITADPKFRRSFRIRHRKPPLLGLLCCYSNGHQKVSFRSTLDKPHKICSKRLSLRDDYGLQGWQLMDCRHGHALFVQWEQHRCSVWDPIAQEYYPFGVPLEFHNPWIVYRHWAVLCADDDEGHVHGHCHWSHLKVVLVGTYEHVGKGVILASVYSYETASWSNVKGMSHPYRICNRSGGFCSRLVGKTLRWLLSWGRNEITFDLDTQLVDLIEIERPAGVHHSFQLIHSEDGGVALATLSTPRGQTCSLQMWERMDDSSGVTRSVFAKSVELQTIIHLGIPVTTNSMMVGYAEGDHTIFFRVQSDVCMVRLKTMRAKRIYSETNYPCTYHPFKSFFT